MSQVSTRASTPGTSLLSQSTLSSGAAQDVSLDARLFKVINQITGKQTDLSTGLSPMLKEQALALLEGHQESLKTAYANGRITFKQLLHVEQLESFISRVTKQEALAARAEVARLDLEAANLNPAAVVALIGFGLSKSTGSYGGAHTISQEGLISLAGNKRVPGDVATNTLRELIKLGAINEKRGACALASTDDINQIRGSVGDAIRTILDIAHSDKKNLALVSGVQHTEKQDHLSSGAKRSSKTVADKARQQLFTQVNELHDELKNIADQRGPAPLPSGLLERFKQTLTQISKTQFGSGSLKEFAEGISRVYYHRLDQSQRAEVHSQVKDTFASMFSRGHFHRNEVSKLACLLSSHHSFYRNGAFIGALLDWSVQLLTAKTSLFTHEHQQLGKAVLGQVLGILELGQVQPGVQSALIENLKARAKADARFRGELSKAISGLPLSLREKLHELVER